MSWTDTMEVITPRALMLGSAIAIGALGCSAERVRDVADSGATAETDSRAADVEPDGSETAVDTTQEDTVADTAIEDADGDRATDASADSVADADALCSEPTFRCRCDARIFKGCCLSMGHGLFCEGINPYAQWTYFNDCSCGMPQCFFFPSDVTEFCPYEE